MFLVAFLGRHAAIKKAKNIGRKAYVYEKCTHISQIPTQARKIQDKIGVEKGDIKRKKISNVRKL